MIFRCELNKEEMTKAVKQFIKMEMLKKDINFINLYKRMIDKGYDYSLDTIRQEVGNVHIMHDFFLHFVDNKGKN